MKVFVVIQYGESADDEWKIIDVTNSRESAEEFRSKFSPMIRKNIEIEEHVLREGDE